MNSKGVKMSSPYGELNREVKSALDDLSADESVYVPRRPAVELFRLDDGVQIFFVAPDKRVSALAGWIGANFDWNKLQRGAKFCSQF